MSKKRKKSAAKSQRTKLLIHPRTILEGYIDGADILIIYINGHWHDAHTGDPMPESFEMVEWRVVAGGVEELWPK